MQKAAVVAARGVGKAFGGNVVLQNVDLALNAYQVHAIVGENGAGKSTIAKILGGIHAPSEGCVELHGQAVRFTNPRQALAHGIALIHQEPLTFPNLTVAENVFVGNQPLTKLRQIEWREMRRRTVQLFESLGVRISPDRLAGGLSIADQQMIELASALNHEAEAIIFDETTAALTPKEVAELFLVVRRLRDQGKAIAIVTHRLHEVFEISNEITVLRDGVKVFESPTSDTNPQEVVNQMVGREFDSFFSDEAFVEPGNVVLELKNLTVVGIFDDVSLSLKAGEILGVAGLVGAGRTELCETIFGIRKATAGSVVVDGNETKIRTPSDAMKAGIAMVPEDRQHHGLLLPIGIGVNVTLAAPERISRLGWLADTRDRALGARWTAATGVKCSGLPQPVGQLSGGNQQKVSFAKWLLTEPRILILDEPTRGVDVRSKSNLHAQIRDLVTKSGLAILMVSSDLNEILALSDRIAIMRAGKMVGEFDRASADPAKVMSLATGTGIDGQVGLAS